jgi:hypothetical protein
MSFQNPIQQGHQSLHARQPADALKHFASALGINPGSVEARLGMIQARILLKDFAGLSQFIDQTLSMQLNGNEGLMAKYLSAFPYFHARDDEAAFKRVKEVVTDVENARPRNAFPHYYQPLYVLDPSWQILQPDDLAIVSHLWRFMIQQASSGTVRYLAKQRGFWPKALDGPGIQPPVVLNSASSGPGNPVPFEKLRNTCVVFNDGVDTHQLKVSGVFLKCRTYGHKARWRFHQGFTIVDSAGNPATIEVTGARVSDAYLHSLDLEAFCHVNRFNKTIIQIRERGKLVKGDNNKVFLEWLMPGPGKKVVLRDNKNLIPACKHCDGPLLSRTVTVTDDEWKLPACPYCNNTLEVIWREARTIAMEFDHDPSDWAQFSHATRSSRIHADMMPVMYNGILRPVAYKRAAVENFLQVFVLGSPGQTLGPLCIGLQHVSRGGNCFLNQTSISSMVPGAPAVNWQKDLESAASSQIISRIEDDETKKQAAAERVANREAREQKRKARDEARAKKELARSLNASPSIEIPTLIEHDVPFNIAKTLSKTYLHLESTDRDINWATYTASLRRGNGDRIPQIVVDTGRKWKQTCTLDKIVIETAGLSNLMQMIQKSAKDYFSSVKFYVMESTVQYQDGLVHQYLKPVLNEPGKPTSVPKAGRNVHACAACDAMLLRFSFNWVFQNDDFKLATCPYCKSPLKTIERKPKLVSVFLDPDAKGCVVTGTNNQIGAIYHGVPVKLTVKVKSMMHFLQNFEHLFTNNVIGPLDLKFAVRPRSPLVYLNASEFSQFERGIEWRPVVLYPEDLIAL